MPREHHYCGYMLTLTDREYGARLLKCEFLHFNSRPLRTQIRNLPLAFRRIHLI